MEFQAAGGLLDLDPSRCTSADDSKRGQRDLAGEFSVPDSEVSVFEAPCDCWIVSLPAVTPAVVSRRWPRALCA